MSQLLRLWNSLSLIQRISLCVVPLVLALSVWSVTRWRHESGFRVLYSALAPEDASALTQKIREAGIEYRLDETGATISVPAERLAEARLALAGAGLPRTGRMGFEGLDRPNLGASDFTEQVNYHRALEGELERTVSSLAAVSQARIHITFARDSVFLDAKQPAKATVVLTLRQPGGVSPQSILAIANLVAGAVESLTPEAVAIIDATGRLLNRPGATDDGARLAEANLDYRRQLEAGMMTRINAALEPVLGPDKFRAGISVDLDFTSSEENAETYDPGSSATLTSQVTEESNSTSLPSGAPGTASNLPLPPARPASGASGISRRTENVTYQPSRVVRHVVSPRGAVRRISTAIVIDQAVTWEGAGPKARRVLTPPSPEVLKGVHDIVAGITGFSEQRGDLITVESVPFDSTLALPPPPAPRSAPAPGKPLDLKQLTKQPLVIGGAAGGLLLLVGGSWFLLRRRKAKRAAAEAEDTAPDALPEVAPHDMTPQLTADERAENQIAQAIAEQERAEAEAIARIQIPASTGRSEVLIRHIRDTVAKDPSSAANVLRTWVAEKEARRS